MRPNLGRPETAGDIATALMVGPPENGTRQRAAMQRGLGARPRAWLRSSRLWRLGRCERLLPGSRRLTCTLGDREPLPAIRRRPRLRAGVRSGGNDGSWRVLRLVPHMINDSYKLTNVNWLDRAGCWNRKNGPRHRVSDFVMRAAIRRSDLDAVSFACGDNVFNPPIARVCSHRFNYFIGLGRWPPGAVSTRRRSSHFIQAPLSLHVGLVQYGLASRGALVLVAVIERIGVLVTTAGGKPAPGSQST